MGTVIGYYCTVRRYESIGAWVRYHGTYVGYIVRYHGTYAGYIVRYHGTYAGT